VASGLIPPFKLKALLRLAWGLTLNLSGDEAQQNMGIVFNEIFKKLWDQNSQNENTLRYLHNINGTLSSFLRNIGYEKDFLVVELDTQAKIRDKEIENVNQLADMTSLSSDGLITRIVAFFIGGSTSLLGAWQSLFQSQESTPSLTNGTLNEVVTKINNMTITNQSSTEITRQSISVPDTLPNELIVFLLGGSVAFFILIVAMKWVKGWWIKNRILSKTIQEQQQHWEDHVRPEFIRLMKAFLIDVRQITKEHFNQYQEDILGWNDKELVHYIDTIIPRKNLYIHDAELSDLKNIRDWQFNI
jgi:hypothetical protein